jgi:hypothetical protein
MYQRDRRHGPRHDLADVSAQEKWKVVHLPTLDEAEA